MNNVPCLNFFCIIYIANYDSQLSQKENRLKFNLQKSINGLILWSRFKFNENEDTHGKMVHFKELPDD